MTRRVPPILLALAVAATGCFNSASETEDGGSSGSGAGTGGSATAGTSGGPGGASSSTGAHASSGGISGVATGGSSSGGITGTDQGTSGGTGTIAGATGGSGSGGTTGSSTGSTGSITTTGTSNGGTTGGVVTTSGGTTGGVVSSGGSTGGSQGNTCTVPQSGQPDPCSGGLVCIGPSPISATGTCQLPTNGYACDPSVGCVSGDSCVGQTGQTYCYQQCTTTSDCSEAYETCQQAGVGPTGSLCIYETCSNFYQPCNVVGTDDGYCVPFSNPPNPDYGLCIAGAPADAGLPASCTTFGRGGGLCPVGMICYTDYETTGTQCQPFCSAQPINGSNGPGCGTGEFCVSYYGNLFGSCAPTCAVPDHPTECDAGQNCLVTGEVYGDGGAVYTCEP